jgi:cyclic pyranopterin phosphate synthase
MPLAPTDHYERKIDYLRLSVTDRCNLRCTYCMPPGGVPKLTHTDVLRYEEILRLARIAVDMGISKIRITGGEPLLRKDILYLCEKIASIPGVKSLSMTTNGVLLSRFAKDLLNAGLQRINISLDTLEPEKFAAITRHDYFHEVWQSILTAHEVGLSPIKLNAVVMQGVNDDEIEDLARLTFQYPFHVRFIEFMPFLADEHSNRFLSSDEILERLKRMGPLVPTKIPDSNGPASHYRFAEAKGMIGIISPISHHFCPTCNRLRLTSDGKLRTCLFATEETDLKPMLRNGSLDSDIANVIRNAIEHKPEKHALDSAVFRKCINRSMSSIGG